MIIGDRLKTLGETKNLSHCKTLRANPSAGAAMALLLSQPEGAGRPFFTHSHFCKLRV